MLEDLLVDVDVGLQALDLVYSLPDPVLHEHVLLVLLLDEHYH